MHEVFCRVVTGSVFVKELTAKAAIVCADKYILYRDIYVYTYTQALYIQKDTHTYLGDVYITLTYIQIYSLL